VGLTALTGVSITSLRAHADRARQAQVGVSEINTMPST